MKRILILLTIMIGIISGCKNHPSSRIYTGCNAINLPKGEIFKDMIINSQKYLITKNTLGNHRIYFIESSGFLEERNYIINN